MATESKPLFVEGQNPKDEPTRQYRWDRPERLIQNERHAHTFYAGSSAKL